MAQEQQSWFPPPEETELRESRTQLHLAHERAATVHERGQQYMHFLERALTPPADPPHRRKPEPQQ